MEATQMWTDLGVIFGYATLLFSVVLYASWCYVRPIAVRQELFAVRDKLWLRAYKLEGLQDPAYLASRKQINAIINLAPILSLPTVLSAIFSRTAVGVHRRESENIALQRAIDHAMHRVHRIMIIYLFLWRLSGALLIPILPLLYVIAQLRSGTRTRIKWAVNRPAEDVVAVLVDVSRQEQESQLSPC